MRICLITPELPPFHFGGIGQYVSDLAAEYARTGHDVTVVGIGLHEPDRIQHDWGVSVSLPAPRATTAGKFARHVGQRLCRVRGAWRWGLRLTEAALRSRAQQAAKLLAEYCAVRERDFDVIEAPNWLGQAALVSPRHAKLVVRLSTPAEDCDPTCQCITPFEALLCRHADLIIGNSYAIVEKTTPLYKLDGSRRVVIPHGVADAPLPDVKRRANGLDVLYVGRCEPRKGTDIILEAVAPALEKWPGLAISFVGFDPSDLARTFPHLLGLWNSIRTKYGSRVRCLGRVRDDEKLALYAASHWVVVPSRFESFGLVAIEAIRAGTPFMAADVGGLGEIAAQAPGCVAVRPNAAAAWTQALDDAARGGAAAAELVRARCRDTFIQKYTAQRMAQDSLDAYEKLRASGHWTAAPCDRRKIEAGAVGT
jgi:glycosyltransferase involved in cell wall biosynthesis